MYNLDIFKNVPAIVIELYLEGAVDKRVEIREVVLIMN